MSDDERQEVTETDVQEVEKLEKTDMDVQEVEKLEKTDIVNLSVEAVESEEEKEMTEEQRPEEIEAEDQVKEEKEENVSRKEERAAEPSAGSQRFSANAPTSQHASAHFFSEDGKSEAQVRMEQEAKRRKERAEEEWREYEEFRRGEREKAEEEIRQLRERRERRKTEREEEEKRLNELRQVEEQKRRAEEEERQRKKREEEQRKREERERKRQEWEERKNANRPNFVITKREGGELHAQVVEEVEKKEAVTKSKEQIEAERKSIIEQRVPPLNISSYNLEQLKAKAKELHDLLFRIEGENYDLGERFKRQSYDMQELAERARQMNKGGKARAIPNELDARAAKFSGIPPMVVMYSQYERVKDPRSFTERRTVFHGENYAEEYQRITPKRMLVMGEDGFHVAGSAPGGESAATAD